MQILRIINNDIPLNYILESGSKTLSELCKKDTGICDETVGIITLDNYDIRLSVYAEFDNPDDLALIYFKFDDKKIGSFVYLNKFEIFNEKYLLITELNSYNNNLVIHFYDKTGKEVASYEATNLDFDYKLENNELYYYHCNSAESNMGDGENLPKVSYYKINPENITEKIEISSNYQKCA
ncbi:MAG: hypothetical protein PHX04_06775 [Bacilli bacterium]|nr:hypothetical protein [Bacilli bacterium]